MFFSVRKSSSSLYLHWTKHCDSFSQYVYFNYQIIWIIKFLFFSCLNDRFDYWLSIVWTYNRNIVGTNVCLLFQWRKKSFLKFFFFWNLIAYGAQCVCFCLGMFNFSVWVMGSYRKFGIQKKSLNRKLQYGNVFFFVWNFFFIYSRIRPV